MVTMIEKMARAMAVDDSGPEGSQIFDIHWAEFGNGYKSSARASLEALLEPSMAMMDAGTPVMTHPMRSASVVYSIMIQAALDEK